MAAVSDVFPSSQRPAVPRLMAITPSGDSAIEVLSWLRGLVDGVRAATKQGEGLAASDIVVQVRDPGSSTCQLLERLDDLRSRARDLPLRWVLNSDWKFATGPGVDGVHLTSEKLASLDEGTRRSQPSLLLGASTHSLREVEQAAAHGLDYVVFGPVFDTPSKRSFGKPRGLLKLSEATRVGIPVLALGGIDATNSARVLDAGAHGLAGIRSFGDGAEVEAMLRDLGHRFPARHAGAPAKH